MPTDTRSRCSWVPFAVVAPLYVVAVVRVWKVVAALVVAVAVDLSISTMSGGGGVATALTQFRR